MNIIISGLTCSGKTTLSNKIASISNNVTIFREDDYMKDLSDIPHLRNHYLLDVENAYHVSEFKSDVLNLIENGSSLYPKYDVLRNKRVSKNEIRNKKEINVFEGLHTIELLKDLRDSIKVFINIDYATCLERRIKRDIQLYNAKEDDVRRYFNEIIMSIYKTHIYPQIKDADIVIERGEDELCLLKKFQTN